MTSRIQRWLLLIGTGVFLFQPTTGCPDRTQVLGVAATSTESLVTGIFGLFVKSAVRSTLGI